MNADSRTRRVLVVGGAGYVGSVLTGRLLAAGTAVRVLDSLLYGNGMSLTGALEQDGFQFQRGDIRDIEDIRAGLEGVTDVVLLAALVGDPVCKRNPELARETNLTGARNLLDACAEASVERFVFASTCSNYGLREDDVPATEEDDLHPLSLYAETKVEVEKEVMSRAGDVDYTATVLRVATAYGISPRMRFDLTVSEFTRELAMGRELEVYDADTWRPYCHVRDISAAIRAVLDAPSEAVDGQVFNAGEDRGNYTKRMIVEAAVDALDGEADVKWSEGGVDPRNYRVSFTKIKDVLGFQPQHTVPGSIERLIVAVRSGIFDDVEERPHYYGNANLSSTGDEAGKTAEGIVE